MYLCVSACVLDIVLVIYSAITTSSVVHSFLVLLGNFLLQSVFYNDTFSLVFRQRKAYATFGKDSASSFVGSYLHVLHCGYRLVLWVRGQVKKSHTHQKPQHKSDSSHHFSLGAQCTGSLTLSTMITLLRSKIQWSITVNIFSMNGTQTSTGCLYFAS